MKYGISDVYSNGFDRPESQIAGFKARFGATVTLKILTRTVNRLQAEFIEKILVTKHVAKWNEMPRAQKRPGPF